MNKLNVGAIPVLFVSDNVTPVPLHTEVAVEEIVTEGIITVFNVRFIVTALSQPTLLVRCAV